MTDTLNNFNQEEKDEKTSKSVSILVDGNNFYRNLENLGIENLSSESLNKKRGFKRYPLFRAGRKDGEEIFWWWRKCVHIFFLSYFYFKTPLLLI